MAGHVSHDTHPNPKLQQEDSYNLIDQVSHATHTLGRALEEDLGLIGTTHVLGLIGTTRVLGLVTLVTLALRLLLLLPGVHNPKP